MKNEFESKPELNAVSTKDEVVDFILKNFPEYKIEDINMPVGGEQTSLNDFLENKKDGSEWTDSHGFQINIIDSEYKIKFSDHD